MKKLLLVRHAHTQDQSDSGRDIDRKLTAEGMKNASLLGIYLKNEGVFPQLIYSSPASRAQVTAELIATQLEHPIESIKMMDELYETGARGFLNLLQELPDGRDCVAIVGHNPTISHIADYLCQQDIKTMIPASLVHLNFNLKSWQLLEKETAELIAYYDLPTLTR